ncbi:hypothetical protein ACFWFU_05425 [Streptomyces sp. NPDC060235]
MIRTLISSALLHAGLERGELPADKHDLLTQYSTRTVWARS